MLIDRIFTQCNLFISTSRNTSFAPFLLPTMTSHIGFLPVSVIFNFESPLCLVSASIARSLYYPGVGSSFTEVLTTSYKGRPLTTDVEFVVTRALDSDVVVGMNWINAWCSVGAPEDNEVSAGGEFAINFFLLFSLF